MMKISDKLLNKAVGLAVAGFRISQRRSQDTVCEETGMHQAAISRIESGKQKLSIPQMFKLSQCLGISNIAFLSEVEEQYEWLLKKTKT